VVMYHYVRPDGSRVPGGIRPLLCSELEAQLDWIEERYDIVGGDEFLAWMEGRSRRRRPPCLLTFDDGVRDQHDVVLPILRRRGLSAIVFVLTWPCTEGRMPLTHAVHWLLGRNESAVWAAIEAYAERELGGVGQLPDAETAQAVYPWDSAARGRIKYAANLALPHEAVEQIVSLELARDGLRVDDLAGEWFVTTDEIRALDAAGVEIGMHGVSHRSLQQLGPQGIRDEIAACHATLHDVLGRPPTWWATPFGGNDAPAELLAVMTGTLREFGVRGACSTAKALPRPGDDALDIPRLDAVDLPPRREPLLAAIPRGVRP